MTANVGDKNTVLVVMSSTSHNSQLTALAIDSTNGSEQHQQLYYWYHFKVSKIRLQSIKTTIKSTDMILKNERNWPCLTVLMVVKAQIHETKQQQKNFNLTFLNPRKQIVPNFKCLEKGVNFIKAFLESQT